MERERKVCMWVSRPFYLLICYARHVSLILRQGTYASSN